MGKNMIGARIRIWSGFYTARNGERRIHADAYELGIGYFPREIGESEIAFCRRIWGIQRSYTEHTTWGPIYG